MMSLLSCFNRGQQNPVSGDEMLEIIEGYNISLPRPLRFVIQKTDKIPYCMRHTPSDAPSKPLLIVFSLTFDDEQELIKSLTEDEDLDKLFTAKGAIVHIIRYP
jgi:hypothetical protein